jgi:hypothetical protein
MLVDLEKIDRQAFSDLHHEGASEGARVKGARVTI